MPDRPSGARHRAPRAPGHRRLLSGLALPTVAAAALALTATGASIDAHPQADLSASSPVMRSAQQQSREQRLARTDQQVARTGSAQVAALATGRAEATQRAARAARRQAIGARALALAKAAQRRAEARAHAWRLPIRHYTLTSGFGHRWGRLHAGNDFAAPVGSRLVAMSSGTVTQPPTTAFVIPGTYDAHWRHVAGSTVPRNEDARFRKGLVIDGSPQVIDVPSLEVSGDILLNGRAPPQTAYENAQLSLATAEGVDRAYLGQTQYGGFSARVVPGRYDIVYEHLTGGSSLPSNPRATLARGLESGGPADENHRHPGRDLRGHIPAER